MAKDYRVAIMGATGAVGRVMLEILEERNFPLSELRLLASSRSAGETIEFRGQQLVIEELTTDSFEGLDLMFASAGGKLSKQFSPHAVRAGAVVIDNTSAFRMDPDVPLVVPEVNEEDLANHKGIIANPNCSTIIMVVAVWPLHQAVPVRRVVVSTYQAVSGAGARAMEELNSQMKQILSGAPAQPREFSHQIAFNLFSHDSAIGPEGYCEEEMKMVKETRKLFHCERIGITATTIRVPVMRAHSEAINLEFEAPMLVEDARLIFEHAAGIRVVDDRERNYFPMPIEAAGQDEVLVGRLRQDISREGDRGLDLWVSGDQLRNGAALNAVQIAERLAEMKVLRVA